MPPLRFRLHGLPVSIEANDRDLGDFVREYFEEDSEERPPRRDGERPARGSSGAPADEAALVAIRAQWQWGKPGQRRFAENERAARAERVGRGLVLCPGAEGGLAAVWTRVPDFPELTLGFELTGETPGRLLVDATCAYAPRGLARKLKYLRKDKADLKRNRLFFKLMYFMAYYPMAWYLERTRGWGLLHASAVTLPSGRSLILSGLGGVGKSTLGLALAAREGSRLLSDNLIFHDEERIYACPEPVRLDDSALAGMSAGAGRRPERTNLPASAHPKPTYRVEAGRLAPSGVPEAVYFLRFAPRSGVTPLEPARAAEMLLAGNHLAREIKDYAPCSALLTMLAAENGGPPPAPRARLIRLLEPARSFLFRIGEGERIEDTVARLAERVEALA